MSDAVEEAIEAFVDKIAEYASGVRWARRANLHLTLRFLGAEVDPTMLAPLGEMLAQIAAETPPFDVTAHGTGVFPSIARPRVVWIGLIGAELAQLAQRVETAVVQCGFERDRRPYSPHLTIGRVRNLRGWGAVRRLLSDAVQLEFGATHVDSLILYRSVLKRDAARYEELARFGLAGTRPLREDTVLSIKP
jgi:RNA 2',3'-cyclic 3'-phosphodiesterase